MLHGKKECKEEEEGRGEGEGEREREKVRVREKDEGMAQWGSLLVELQPHHSWVLAQVVLFWYQRVRRKTLGGRGEEVA